MIYGSVCSGIEAATVAWKPLGWRPAFFSEIEKFPSAVLAHHYPDVPNFGDLTQHRKWKHEPIDVLVGGTPCQSFSVAGLRKGLDDPRGNLALEFLALAERARPRWVVWENVPGVLSVDGGRAFGSILGAMGQLGYGWAYRILDAQYFGVPQRRRRVFLVGYLGDWRRAAAVLFERESLSRNNPPRRETGQAVAPTISARPTGGGGLGTDFDCDGGLIAPAGDECQNLVAHSLRGEGFDAIAFDCKAGGNTSFSVGDVPGALRGEGHGGGHAAIAFSSKDHGADAGEIAPTLRAMGHGDSHANGGGQVAVAFQTSGYGGSVDEVASTMQASYDRLSNQVYGCIEPSSAVRRLTPRECERLQGFPDDYSLVPYRGKPAADGPRYKALGNSMAVPVMRWIGSRIAAVDAIEGGATYWPEQATHFPTRAKG